jgi:hypothetical protein
VSGSADPERRHDGEPPRRITTGRPRAQLAAALTAGQPAAAAAVDAGILAEALADVWALSERWLAATPEVARAAGHELRSAIEGSL